jgi:CDP-paratose 2-epimerase
LREALPDITIYGIDNLSRRGAETSLSLLQNLEVTVFWGDIRLASDVDVLPDVDWVIDCAANPSVLAGLEGSGMSSRQILQHNLLGSQNILEYCKQRLSGLVLLSTSRVYSIPALRALPLQETVTRFSPELEKGKEIQGFSRWGISESFSTAAPVSFYGASKFASERIALEYHNAFDIPLWINRSGVIGGPGQFGRADQGIMAFWIYSFLLGRPLRYIGFGGSGKQVRDFVLAEDVADLIIQQITSPSRSDCRVLNIGGGNVSAFSLLELTEICGNYFGVDPNISGSCEERPYDIPYYVTDTRLVQQTWDWRPSLVGRALVEHLCDWAVANRDFVTYLMMT